MSCTEIPSYGQPAEKKPGGSFGGLGFFKPGIHTIQFSKMNDFLPDSYPMIGNNPLVTGGAGYAVFSNIMVGGEGGTIRAGSFTKSDQ